MAAAEFNLTGPEKVTQGGSYRKEFDFSATITDVTGYLGRSHIRNGIENATIAAQFQVQVVSTPFIGVILTLGATDTEPIEAGTDYVYDVELYKPQDLDDVIPVVFGTVEVKREVTRP